MDRLFTFHSSSTESMLATFPFDVPSLRYSEKNCTSIWPSRNNFRLGRPKTLQEQSLLLEKEPDWEKDKIRKDHTSRSASLEWYFSAQDMTMANSLYSCADFDQLQRPFFHTMSSHGNDHAFSYDSYLNGPEHRQASHHRPYASPTLAHEPQEEYQGKRRSSVAVGENASQHLTC